MPWKKQLRNWLKVTRKEHSPPKRRRLPNYKMQLASLQLNSPRLLKRQVPILSPILKIRVIRLRIHQIPLPTPPIRLRIHRTRLETLLEIRLQMGHRVMDFLVMGFLAMQVRENPGQDLRAQDLRAQDLRVRDLRVREHLG